jgi:hypothetical protein
MKRIVRATTVLVAPGVMAVALLAACGGSDAATSVTPTGEGVEAPATARLEAQAERYELSAHLQGQATTYGNAAPTDEAPAPADETSDDRFVPGTRHMPTR